jgi:protein SCO1/2
MKMWALLCLILLISTATSKANDQPPLLSGVGFDQKLNQQMPLDVTFRDETGSPVKLAQYFGKKPVLISFAYYSCPMLCTIMLDGLARGLKATPAEIGSDYEAVNISINPEENSALAAKKKKEYEKKYGRLGAAEGWHFLTGDEASIRKATDAAGFRYKYDPVSKQFAHVTGILIATPDGKISRYLYGIVFSPRDLRMALSEASSGKIGSPVDKLLLFCYHYDALTGKYSLLVMRVLKMAGGLTLLLIGLLWIILHIKIKRSKTPQPATRL